MADSVVFSGVSSHILSNNKDKISEYDCNKCRIYEKQLQEALEELESARKIIDILQNELHISTIETACANDLDAMHVGSDQSNTKEWTLVSSKNYTVKPNITHICETTSPDQLVMTTNRFTPLGNLQTNIAGSTGTRSRPDGSKHRRGTQQQHSAEQE